MAVCATPKNRSGDSPFCCLPPGLRQLLPGWRYLLHCCKRLPTEEGGESGTLAGTSVHHRLTRTRWLWGLVLSWVFVHCPAAAAPTQAAAEGAFARGLGWVKQYPATPEDGGILDMIDEGLFFLVLADLSRQAEERAGFAQAGRERMAAIERLAQFEAWVRHAGLTGTAALFAYRNAQCD